MWRNLIKCSIYGKMPHCEVCIMSISIINESDIDYPEEFDEIIKTVIDASVTFVKCPYECEVSVTLTDNDGIHEINSSERGIDSPTDVL